jgi:hypothetical protein
MKLTEPGKGTLTNSDLQKVAVTFEPISPNVSSFREEGKPADPEESTSFIKIWREDGVPITAGFYELKTMGGTYSVENLGDIGWHVLGRIFSASTVEAFR